MTRINCVPVEELHDKHLLAEYRELPRVFTLAHNAIEKGSWESPAKYALGTGHVKFFYNKLTYLAIRHIDLCNEMKRRKFKVNIKNIHEKWIVFLSSDYSKYKKLWNDWTPNENAIKLNRQRINERLKQMRNK